MTDPTGTPSVAQPDAPSVAQPDPAPFTVDVGREMARLKDFQRATADYAFRRLFGDGAEATSRFLVADEVGLGKTMVARGVIAQTIDHLQRTGDHRVDVVYICSNSAIAGQNLAKLMPPGITPTHETERLPLLAFRLSARQFDPVNFIALTPGTALKSGWSAGTWPERAAVMRALGQLWGRHRLRGTGMAHVFAAGIGPGDCDSVEERIRHAAFEDREWLPPALSDEALDVFARQLDRIEADRAARGLDDIDSALHRLAPAFRHGEAERRATRSERNGLIRDLREALAATGARLLQPDIVVLDEFQRFRDILHDSVADDPRSLVDFTADIARRLFTHHHAEFGRSTRVLMLSATPYVMHTTAAESATSGDEHYEDFLATFRFLAEGLPGEAPDVATKHLRIALGDLRTALATATEHGADPAHRAAAAVSDRLRRVMARTERLAATPDRDGMLRTVPENLPVPGKTALKQYASAAQVAERIAARTGMHSSDVVAYWKAAPYTLSFLGGHDYQLARRLREAVGPEAAAESAPASSGSARFDLALASMLRRSPAVLPWERMRGYGKVPARHSGLDRLWQDYFAESHAERLLWLPPSLPYYSAGGDFETPAARRLTKRLIFSAWTLAPTSIATLTSYECERRLHDAAQKAGAPTYRYDAQRRSVQHLNFETMIDLQFLLPLPVLAELGDPLTISAGMRGDDRTAPHPTLADVLERVRARVAERIDAFVSGRPRVPRGQGAGAWYALAPVLLEGDAWHLPALGALGHTDDDRSYLRSRLARLQELRAATRCGGEDLPPVPEDLEDVVALAAVAGPPAIMLRSLSRLLPTADAAGLAEAAMIGAEGLRSRFNSPMGNQVINAFDGNGVVGSGADFWRKALAYCASGNLQAVVDEYVSVVAENKGFAALPADQAARATAGQVYRALSLRTTLYRPAVMTTGRDGLDERWRPVRLRGHFAMRYGAESTADGSAQRLEDVSGAFNSPFWPFVLASTSVGQEGLDFHLYSHAVSHWNLPTNPVDLEQREGRVHRYKCHAVRKNVAAALPFPSGEGDPWRELFTAAEAGRADGDTDMVPYWVYSPDELGDDAAAIERHLPIAPYTRERSVIDSLVASVSMYRLAFGQPRQEEFVDYVMTDADEDLREELAEVRIDLRPDG